VAVRTCACGCGEALAKGARWNRIYLNDKHQRRQTARNYNARKRTSERGIRNDRKRVGTGSGDALSFKGKDESLDNRGSYRRGPKYEAFCETDYPEAILSSEMTNGQVASEYGASHADISRWMAAYLEDRQTGAALKDWTRDEAVDAALMSYQPFVEHFHPEALIPDFHLEWEQEIDGVVGNGGRLVLLAPQRHGKTEFLIRYCQRRIAADPDICILWVSRAKELAEESVGMLRQLLEDEKFGEAVLGPGQTFRPPARSGKSWTDEKLTVGQRTRIRKSPTVRALGIGGTTSGRDADLIIVDDPQEREDCVSPTTREKQSRWFMTTLLARKMEKTGIALITSRRHIDDIPGKLIKDHAEDWRTIIYRAHKLGCPKPEADSADHADCILWPELRSHKFLMGQKRADVAFFECNYQNNPSADSLVLIKAEHLERCKDFSRSVGAMPKNATRYIAGIDPAEAKPVAAVLWAWEPSGTMHIVDTLEAEPGVRGGRQIVTTWFKKYACREFVVEKNIAQSWWQDKELSDFCARNGIPKVREHYTDRTNKMDPKNGVPSMYNDMRTDPPKITFPYGDRDSQQQMDRLLRTFLLFDPDHAGGKHADDDLPMAAWFGHHVMQKWTVQRQDVAEYDYSQTQWVSSTTQYAGVA